MKNSKKKIAHFSKRKTFQSSILTQFKTPAT